MSNDLKDTTLIVHIAYGAILSSAAPWLGILHDPKNHPSSLSVDVFSPLALLLLFFSAWLGGAAIIKKYPYFDGEKEYKLYFFDGIRLLLDFLGIITLGISLYLAVQKRSYDVGEYNFDYGAFVFAYFVLIVIWNYLAQLSIASAKVDKLDFAKGIGTVALFILFVIGYIAWKPMMLIAIVLKVLVDLLYLAYLAEARSNDAQPNGQPDAAQ